MVAYIYYTYDYVCFHRKIHFVVGRKSRGGHSHQLSYGGVPLYRVDFERPISLE